MGNGGGALKPKNHPYLGRMLRDQDIPRLLGMSHMSWKMEAGVVLLNTSPDLGEGPVIKGTSNYLAEFGKKH